MDAARRGPYGAGMLPDTAEDFPRAFSQAFATQSGADIAALLAPDGQGLTLSGQWAEDRAAMESAWAAEFSGLLARARLVTGRVNLRMLGPGAAVLSQRYVVSGALDAAGAEMPRIPAVLAAVIIATTGGWQAVSLSFSAISD